MSPLDAVEKEQEETVVAASTTFRPFASVLSVWVLVAGCAGTSERSESVEQVDALLQRIERVQAETAVAKDHAHAALNELCTLVSPNFQGDAALAFAKFITAAEASEEQGDALRDAVGPMAGAADDLFRRWTKDMEAFGNSRMRQRSQTRLDETRTRYQGIVGATQAAQIALDAFHDDLRDQALFLRHDLNATSVASLRTDVREMRLQIDGLDVRFDATVAAAREYVESAALYGQVEMQVATPDADTGPKTTEEKATNSAQPQAPSTTRKRTVTTLKPKVATTRPVPKPDAPKPETTPETTPAPADSSASNATPIPPSKNSSAAGIR